MLKARQQLDTVLKYLYDKKDEARAVNIDVIKADKSLLEMAINESELERMILKLREDKYLQMYPDYPLLSDGKKDMSKGLLSYCSITFDGRLFFENGGYVKEEENILNLEKLTNSREKRLSDGTVFLAIGTFLLVLWEIIKTFWFENLPCS